MISQKIHKNPELRYTHSKCTDYCPKMDFTMSLQSFDQHRQEVDKQANKNENNNGDVQEENPNEGHFAGTMLPDADGFIPPGPVTSHKQKNTSAGGSGQGDTAEDSQMEHMSVSTRSEETAAAALPLDGYTSNSNSNSQMPLVSDLLKEMGQALKIECSHWAQVFQESQQFETFCPTRLDKMLAEAKALEEDLLQQKAKLISRLQDISKTLQNLT